MAEFYTWAQMWSVIQNGELDLEEETFVDKDEAREWANQAINEAEALIMSMNEDYFLAQRSPNLSLVLGADEIALPTDIYAGKVRALVYTNGTRVYELMRIREWHKFLKFRLSRINPTNVDYYRYFIVNSVAGAPKIKLSPPAQESGALVECWYIRNANRLLDDTSICDIPEFVQYVYDHVRTKVYEKEGHFALQKAMADKEATKQLMIDTLTEMVPDNDNTIEADFSHYREHT